MNCRTRGAVTDTHLLLLARSHDGQIATFDRGLLALASRLGAQAQFSGSADRLSNSRADGAFVCASKAHTCRHEATPTACHHRRWPENSMGTRRTGRCEIARALGTAVPVFPLVSAASNLASGLLGTSAAYQNRHADPTLTSTEEQRNVASSQEALGKRRAQFAEDQKLKADGNEVPAFGTKPESTDRRCNRGVVEVS